MKDIRKNLIGMSIFALLLSGAFVKNINAQRQSSDTAAIRSLRETGDYDSLKAAFEVTRQPNGDIGNRPDEASVRHVKLTPPANSYNARFGSSVAVSGNTAVIGAYNEYTAWEIQEVQYRSSSKPARASGRCSKNW
jgi:hypothetical protein